MKNRFLPLICYGLIFKYMVLTQSTLNCCANNEENVIYSILFKKNYFAHDCNFNPPYSVYEYAHS